MMIVLSDSESFINSLPLTTFMSEKESIKLISLDIFLKNIHKHGLPNHAIVENSLYRRLNIGKDCNQILENNLDQNISFSYPTI